MGTLDGKVAVITGASSGIGRATALLLASEGAAVAITGRKQEALNEVAAAATATGARVLARTMDARDEGQIIALIDSAVHELGGLDILVNNAGVGYAGPIADGDTEQWREMLETNILGLLIGCREAVRVMRERGAGHIVNMSSVAARGASPGNQVYGATKHAVNAISEGLRQELQGSGIRVTVVMPGGTLTNFARHFPQEVLDNAARALGVDPEREGVRHGEYLPAEGVERILREHPGILLSPDDLARAVLYAVSQPPSVHVDDVLVRPAVGFSLGA